MSDNTKIEWADATWNPVTGCTRVSPKGNEFDPFERGHPDWATRIDRVGKRAAGRELDGRTWDEYPEATR